MWARSGGAEERVPTGAVHEPEGYSTLGGSGGASALQTCRLRWCLLLVIGTALPGCAGGRVNLWPIFFHEARSVRADSGPRVVKTTEVLYPLFTRQSDPDGTWHALRPFYNYDHRNGTDQRRVQYMWPLGLHFSTPGGEGRHSFFPFFGYVKVDSADPQRSYFHGHVLQFLRWGRNDAGPYFALFPLAGVTHGVISDTWSFLLFPLLSYYRQGDYVRWDVVWPFAGRGRSPDGSIETWRAWPFYVHKRQDRAQELREAHRLLWFLARWGIVDRRGDYYHSVFAALPFYATIRTWDRSGNLIAHQTSVLGVGFSRDSRDKPQRTGWSLLWTLVRKSSEPKLDDSRIFPFYWRVSSYPTEDKEAGRSWTRRKMLWPILWIDSDNRNPQVHMKGLVVAPFYWHYAQVYRDQDGPARTGRSITLWPLATWQQDPDGARHVWAVSHGWKDTTTGFKRNYRAFLDFFQYHRDAQGERETRILGRLYHHRRGAAGRYLSLASLFTYDGTGDVVGEQGKYFSALFGLVKCSWTDEWRRWRIFYVPLGGPPKSNAENGDDFID